MLMGSIAPAFKLLLTSFATISRIAGHLRLGTVGIGFVPASGGMWLFSRLDHSKRTAQKTRMLTEHLEYSWANLVFFDE